MRIRVKEVENVKYPIGTIKAFKWVSSPASLPTKSEVYTIICVLSVFKVKKIRYRVLVLSSNTYYTSWYRRVYDLTENKLEEYYFQNCSWVAFSEKSLEFVVRFGNTPMGVVQECLESTSFQTQLKREVTSAATRLEKAQRQLESVEQLRKILKGEA